MLAAGCPARRWVVSATNGRCGLHSSDVKSCALQSLSRGCTLVNQCISSRHATRATSREGDATGLQATAAHDCQLCGYRDALSATSCKFQTVPGQLYCGNHLFQMTGQGRKRIPCPADPTHYVYEDQLRSHLKKCPKAVQQREARQLHAARLSAPMRIQARPYFSLDVNTDPLSQALPDAPADDTSWDQDPFAAGRAARRQAVAARLGEAGMRALVGKVQAAHAAAGAGAWQLQTEVLPGYQQLLDADSYLPGGNGARLPFSPKHACQQASILSNLDRAGLASHPSAPTWVEFGAGKGYLASALAQCLPVQRLVLVDTGSFRFKAERGLRRMAGLEVVRVKCDVRHLDLAGVEGVAEAGAWVGVGKHLCGACTDYTLRCCVNGADRSLPSSQRWRGVAVATCCHHRCSWVTYVGKGLMQRLGFTPQEFELLSWMTGWAVCGHEDPRTKRPREAPVAAAASSEAGGLHDAAAASASLSQGFVGRQQAGEAAAQYIKQVEAVKGARAGADERQGLPDEEGLGGGGAGKRERNQGGGCGGAVTWLQRGERIRVGVMCKQLIDAGRAEWLREMGCEVQMVTYADEEVTGENRMLIALPQGRSDAGSAAV